MIYIYECADAPPKRRFLAQHERVENNLYVTCHGPTEAIARAKMEVMLEYRALDAKDRTGFKLKEKLESLGEPAPTRPRRDVDDLA